MGNCLLTQLKAEVNNPNLPVLEIMQQFTLDAIAASGNNSMTDEQKWALNHFFYQIGAISGTGPYTKLQVIGLCFIASSLNTAVNNYKASGSSAENMRSGTSFSNGKITASSSKSICDYAVTGKDNKFFSLIAADGAGSVWMSGDNRVYKMALKVDTFSVNPSPKTDYTSALYLSLAAAQNMGAFNLSGTDVAGWVANASASTPATPTTIHLEEFLGEDLSSITPLTAGGDYGTYGFIYGSGLTDEEAQIVVSAFNELLFNFIS